MKKLAFLAFVLLGALTLLSVQGAAAEPPPQPAQSNLPQLKTFTDRNGRQIQGYDVRDFAGKPGFVRKTAYSKVVTYHADGTQTVDYDGPGDPPASVLPGHRHPADALAYDAADNTSGDFSVESSIQYWWYYDVLYCGYGEGYAWSTTHGNVLFIYVDFMPNSYTVVGGNNTNLYTPGYDDTEAYSNPCELASQNMPGCPITVYASGSEYTQSGRYVNQAASSTMGWWPGVYTGPRNPYTGQPTGCP
jgi:hypothetical protein